MPAIQTALEGEAGSASSMLTASECTASTHAGTSTAAHAEGLAVPGEKVGVEGGVELSAGEVLPMRAYSQLISSRSRSPDGDKVFSRVRVAVR